MISIMIITKLIETGLNIQDPISIYNDPESNIMNILNDRYKNKCVRGCYIISINKIVKMSECVINQDGPPDFGVINLIFEVSAIVYNEGEIITGCTVVSKDKNGIFILSTEYADIILAGAAKRLESIKTKQMIPVMVSGVRYTLGAHKMAIKARPAFISKIPIVYEIKPPTNDATGGISSLSNLIAVYEEQARELKAHNKPAWDFFEQLYYVYKDKQADPSGASKRELFDFINELDNMSAVVYVSRDPRINLATPEMYTYDSTEALPSPHQLITMTPAQNVLVELMDSYCNFLKLIIDHINTYNTQELLDSHKNLWIIYRDAKLRS